MNNQNQRQDDGVQELAAIFARGYVRLQRQRAGERQSVHQRGGERRLDVPGEESVLGPAVNTRVQTNPNREGGSHEHSD